MSVSDTVQDDEFTSPLVCSETEPPPMSSSTLGLSSALGLHDFIQQHVNPWPSLGRASLGHCLPLEDPAGATLHLLPLDSPEQCLCRWRPPAVPPVWSSRTRPPPSSLVSHGHYFINNVLKYPVFSL